MKRIAFTFIGLSGLATPSLIWAQETTTYTYDALGRLVTTSTVNGPNNNRQNAICYDAAGNRTAYNSAVGSAPCSTTPPPPTPTPTPPPPPPPPASNQPPVANADSVSVICWGYTTKNLTANDSDPDGNVPLSLVSVTPVGYTDTSVSILNASTVEIYAGDRSSGGIAFNYVVQDSLGATATGTLTVSVGGSINYCNQ